MKNIDRQAAQAFLSGTPKNLGNTTVTVEPEGSVRMRLHGNSIAYRHGKNMIVTLAGWNTPTTRSRLNALPNVKYSCRKFEPFFNGSPTTSYASHSVSI